MALEVNCEVNITGFLDAVPGPYKILIEVFLFWVFPELRQEKNHVSKKMEMYEKFHGKKHRQPPSTRSTIEPAIWRTLGMYVISIGKTLSSSGSFWMSKFLVEKVALFSVLNYNG